MSLPGPPISKSPPLPPSSESLPVPPYSTSAAPLPRIVSLPAKPSTRSASVDRLKLSLPDSTLAKIAMSSLVEKVSAAL